MKLPKRVPWSDPSELEQLCSWIYTTEEDSAARIHAVNKLAAWKAFTTLPHALESTLSLLIVILQDEDYSNTSTPHHSTLALRHSYSLSLIRLVNGLVDPLQRGAYARPIATIAVQIGLPLWLVELRHASTHEELPSLELLREGAREAMSWLLHNYFLPTISPLNQSAAASPTLPPLSPTLIQYKQLIKMTIRDASLKSRSKSELVRILRDVEEWISEARVAASTVSFDSQTQQDNEDEKERWALARLCDALLGRGGLVPVSKRKRLSPSQGLTVPCPQHVALWSPLILHMHSRYPTFPSVLLSRILTQIFATSKTTADTSILGSVTNDMPLIDPTYDHTLASWALWVVERWCDDPSMDCECGEVAKEALLGLGRKDSRAARSLITALAEKEPGLKESVDLLSTTIAPSSRISAWGDDALGIMSERLVTLRYGAKVVGNSASTEQSTDMEMSAPHDNHLEMPLKNAGGVRGWKLLDEGSGWKPCPIGVLCKRTDS